MWSLVIGLCLATAACFILLVLWRMADALRDEAERDAPDRFGDVDAADRKDRSDGRD